jgi:hypothetical protein
MGTRLASLAMTRLAARLSVTLLALCVLTLWFALLTGHILPNAGQLVYVSEGSRETTLSTLDIMRGISLPLVRYIDDISFFASPDGSQIAFYNEQSVPVLYIVPNDESGLFTVEHINANALLGWMPDNTHLIVEDSAHDIGLIDIRDLSYTHWLSMGETFCRFSLSPDGHWIAIQRPQELRCAGITIAQLDSSAAYSYASNLNEAVPIWSPNSRQLAILNNFSLYIVPDASQELVIEVRDMAMRVPISTLSWSPDSSRFALSADIGFDIFVVAAEPAIGEPVNITRSSLAQDVNPVWLPSGHEIAFISTRDTYNGEIYLMNDDGSNIRRLTANHEREISLVWLP